MLKVLQSGAVARVTLDRPEIRNAFDDALISSLTTALRELDADESVRAVVLAGNGPAFCAGADLNWMKRMAGYGYEQNLADAQALAAMLRTLDRMAKPTVARVQGAAFAGGVGLVAACDIAIGVPEAKFCLSEAKLGLSPATISPYVVRAMGERMARRYFLTAEVFDAAEACRIGLLSAVVPPEKLDVEVEGIVRHLTQGGPQALARIKDLIRAVASGPVDDPLIADTAKRIAEIRVSPEGKEGIASFLEKRKPAWASGADAARAEPATGKK
jgi:methylglutaconyl-CoA hydratase